MVRCLTLGTSSSDQQPQSGWNSTAHLMQTLTDADLNRRLPRHWGKLMGAITLVCIPSLILHRLSRDLIAQMSCDPAIGCIPLGGTRTEPALSRVEGSA